MARPRKSDSDKRTVQVNIRLTETENKTAINYSQSSGMSPANWIRHVAFSGKFPTLKLSVIDAALYRELKKIGVNLNQIAHRINLGEMPPEYQMRQNELFNILKQILIALTNDSKSNQG